MAMEYSLGSALLEKDQAILEFPLDQQPITNARQFLSASWLECRKLWYLAAPAIFTSVAQYSLGAITQVFAGHLTTLHLDAVSVENMVIAGLAFGIMLGMGSALETLCGQAFGAGQLHMLGVYMQRSWVILNTTAVLLSLIYIYATPILRLLGEDDEIAEVAGRFSLWMIPQLFAYAAVFPIQRFLQSQSKVMVMAWTTGTALLFHVFISWLCILKLGWGLGGAAVSLNLSWWIVVFSQLAYILCGYCPGAWTGFSWGAFHGLLAFARLSLASAVMLCLEFWYYTILVILSGHLTNAKVAVAAVSICINLNGWQIMIFMGFNAAISVRISNELGAGRPRAAKFSIIVVVATSMLIGVGFMAAILMLKNVYAIPFTNNKEVANVVATLSTLLALTLLFNSVQPVLSGVAVGAGWQGLVAYVNVACYYCVGVPLGFFLGSYRNHGPKGIWMGMIIGVALQTFILLGITFSTNWKQEATEAIERIRLWGGAGVPQYKVQLRMGRALETLFGQGFGAGQLHMLRVYMQRSWVILNTTAVLLTLMRLLGEDDEIATVADRFLLWMIPQLFAYAPVFPNQRFLQSQSKVIVMARITGIALLFYVFISWLCIMKLGWGLAGAAVSLNLSWRMVVFTQLAYILCDWIFMG